MQKKKDTLQESNATKKKSRKTPNGLLLFAVLFIIFFGFAKITQSRKNNKILDNIHQQQVDENPGKEIITLAKNQEIPKNQKVFIHFHRVIGHDYAYRWSTTDAIANIKLIGQDGSEQTDRYGEITSETDTGIYVISDKKIYLTSKLIQR